MVKKFDPEETRRRIELDRMLRGSSIGDSAWTDCERHGRQVRDPDTGICIQCSISGRF